MRNWIKLFEEESVEALGWIIVSGMIGEAMTVTDVKVRDTKPYYEVGYAVEIFKGKKWQSANVSKSRLMQPTASIVSNKIEGSIWFFERDREAAMGLLKEKLREVLNEMRDRIDRSLTDEILGQ